MINQGFNKEEWAARKAQERRAVFELSEATVNELYRHPEEMAALLNLQSRFPKMSMNNALLVFHQRPDATVLKQSAEWREAGFYIKKGELGISVLAPGKTYTAADGTKKKGYDVQKLFDVSQLNITPEQRAPYQGNNERMAVTRELLLAVMRTSPVRVESTNQALEHNSGSCAYYDHQQKRICVQSGMPVEDCFRMIAVEIAHAELAMGQESYSRSANRWQAQCAAYLICRHYRIEVSGLDVSTIPPEMQSVDVKVKKQKLTQIRQVAFAVAERMDQILNSPKKEMGR